MDFIYMNAYAREWDFKVKVVEIINTLAPNLGAEVEETGGGNICICLTVLGEYWYFGTANDTWDGNDVECTLDQYIETEISSNETDANKVAQAIVDGIKAYKAKAGDRKRLILLDAIKTFSEAAQALGTAWQGNEDHGTESYPFPESFDEMTARIQVWYSTQKDILTK